MRGLLGRGLLLLLAALALSGLWMLARHCNTLGLIAQTDAQAQVQQARAWEQRPAGA